VAPRKPDNIVVKVNVADLWFKSIPGWCYGFSLLLNVPPSLSFNEHKVIQLYTSYPRRGLHIPEDQVARIIMFF
jgi:hypothetical protein